MVKSSSGSVTVGSGSVDRKLPLWSWRLRVVALWMLLITLDQLSKAWALLHLPEVTQARFPYGGWDLGSFAGVQFALVLARNSGAAWSLLEGASDLLWAGRSAILLGLLYYILRRSCPPYGLSLAFLTAGAMSNWLDQSRYGFVIDLFSVTLWGYAYPIFNGADSLICLSALALFWGHCRHS